MERSVVCNMEYDENIIKDNVKKIDAYEKQLIICYAEKGRCQMYQRYRFKNVLDMQNN